jgi:hypothetical protein
MKSIISAKSRRHTEATFSRARKFKEIYVFFIDHLFQPFRISVRGSNGAGELD